MALRSGKGFTAAVLALALGAATGCAAPGSSAEGGGTIEGESLAALPEGTHPCFFDFGGKVHLVGWDASPETEARPGSVVHLKLYWRRVGPLGPGWALFTHLQNDLGQQTRNYDEVGAFRASLKKDPGLAGLPLGEIRVDEQSIELPREGDLTPRVSIVVGVWRRDLRLPVVSGSSDGHSAAVVLHLGTGVARARPAVDPRKPR